MENKSINSLELPQNIFRIIEHIKLCIQSLLRPLRVIPSVVRSRGQHPISTPVSAGPVSLGQCCLPISISGHESPQWLRSAGNLKWVGFGQGFQAKAKLHSQAGRQLQHQRIWLCQWQSKRCQTGKTLYTSFQRNMIITLSTLQINNEVSQKTGGLIKDLLLEEDVDPLTRLLLINAIYFKGK